MFFTQAVVDLLAKEDPTNGIPINNSTLDNDSILRGRIFSSVMSSISICGALLIVTSYILFKDIRTKARLILFHLSLADFGVGMSNLVGALVYYNSFIQRSCHPDINSTLPLLSCRAYIDLCKIEAFFASFFAIASVLWTMLLALYVYVLVHDTGRTLSELIIKFGYFICWPLPCLVSVWLVATKKLGKTGLGGGGWCSLRVEDREGDINFIAVLYGSDIWVISTFLLILVLYSSTHIYLKEKIQEMKKLYNISTGQVFSDYKFLAIPFMFLLLKSGSLLFSILYVYSSTWSKLPRTWRKIFFYWMTIGDSSEGIINAIIFCFLTPKVRRKLFPCSCCKKKDDSAAHNGPPSETLEQKKLLENVDVSCKYSTIQVEAASLSSSVTDD